MIARLARATRRVVRCAWSDPALFAELAFWRISLPLLKRAIGVDRLTQMMWAAPRGGDAAALTARVTSAGRLFLSANCLERSLVWYRLFSRLGLDPRLVMGARRDDGTIAGHVWVEIDGQPFGEPDADRYVTVAVFASGGRQATPASLTGRAHG